MDSEGRMKDLLSGIGWAIATVFVAIGTLILVGIAVTIPFLIVVWAIGNYLI